MISSQCSAEELAVLDRGDDALCAIDDLILAVEGRVAEVAEQIAAEPDQGRFDRMVDQQQRLQAAFNGARRSIVLACERRSNERYERALRFWGAA